MRVKTISSVRASTEMRKIGVDELDLIRDYASVFGKGNNYHYYIFSKGGFTDGLLQAQERGEVQLITMEDLYKSTMRATLPMKTGRGS